MKTVPSGQFHSVHSSFTEVDLFLHPCQVMVKLRHLVSPFSQRSVEVW
jgi:hypothetical protein